ncbi:MAG: hypothetical protein HYS27_01430 [Deltaproteobacteria bacterium]|nr:hypothetical protein [Deltaproteobacteria bacterium]
MNARVAALALLASLVAGGCDPEPFASVRLRVRQPENNDTRTLDERCHGSEAVCLQLSRSLDGAEAERVWFTNDFRGPTAPLPLGSEEHELEVEVFTGAATEPELLGRADPMRIPAIDPEGSDVEITRPVVLATRDRVEPLFESTPGAEANGAACGDEAGNAWFLGATPVAFSTEDLQPRPLAALDVPAGASLSCAAMSELPQGVDDALDARGAVPGRFYAFVGECGTGGGMLHAGSDAVDDSEAVMLGNGCDALLAMRGDLLWVVQGDVVTVHDRGTLERLGASAMFTPPSPPRTSAIVLDDGSLLVAEPAGGTTRYSVAGNVINSANGRNLDVARFVMKGGVAFALTTAKVLVNLDDAGEASTTALLPDVNDILDVGVLRNGTLVVLGGDGVAVEGAPAAVATLSGRNRTALTVTVGGAVLLWGGAGGVDVLVPSTPGVLAAR